VSSVGIVSRTGDDVAAEIIMVRTSRPVPVIAVEGPSDEMFFRPRVREGCYISIGSGKPTVVRALEILAGVPRPVGEAVVGVVDEDYDWALGHSPNVPSLVKTDPRDLEGVLFRTRAVQSVLAEYADARVVAAFELAEGKSVTDLVLEKAAFFGGIRLVSVLGPNVDLSRWKPVRYCLPGWQYDTAQAEVDAVSMGVASSVPELRAAMSTINVPSLWHLARGHDLVDIFCGLLIHRLGATNARVHDVEALLRQAVSGAELDASLLGQRLRAWEAANSPILR
jgi:hypothetical protein